MSTISTLCTAPSLADPAHAAHTLPAWLHSLHAAFQRARQRSRERAMRRAVARSLQGVSRDILRDIGMTDEVPPLPALPRSLSLMDIERGVW
jgi:hypothetical protein